MAVEVDTKSPGIETIDEGTNVTVTEGHLHVRKSLPGSPGSYKTLAIYAPGEWRSARVVDAKA